MRYKVYTLQRVVVENIHLITTCQEYNQHPKLHLVLSPFPDINITVCITTKQKNPKS